MKKIIGYIKFGFKVILLMILCVILGLIFLFVPIIFSHFMKFDHYLALVISLSSMVFYLMILQYVYEKAFEK